MIFFNNLFLTFLVFYPVFSCLLFYLCLLAYVVVSLGVYGILAYIAGKEHNIFVVLSDVKILTYCC
jgi:hypothetical protein